MEDKTQEHLHEDEILIGVIRGTVDDICGSSNLKYSNICNLASRSVDDKNKVVDNIFDLMTDDKMPLSMEAALSQVEMSSSK